MTFTPEIEKTIIGYSLNWKELGISIDVSRLKYKDDALKGEIRVKTFLPGYAPHLHQASYNFSSTRSKAELVKELQKLCSEVDWNVIVEQLRVYIMKYYRQGEPVYTIEPNEKISPPKYLIHPIVPEKKLTILYGEGGVGKSTLALLLSLSAQKDIVGIGFKTLNPVKNVLYLDYETDKETISWQYSKLIRGLGILPIYKLHYRRCTIPLKDDLEAVKEAVVDCQSELLIIDSAGMACGDNLKEAHTANQLALAIRSLNVTTILLSHVSKENSDAKTPYGSVYFYNNARNIWEVRKKQINNDCKIRITLTHRKSNIDLLYPNINLTFEYEPDAIRVNPHEEFEDEE